MIIICEDCGKRYKIDPTKISGDNARFKCKNCSYVMVVKKPDGAPPRAALQAVPDLQAAEAAPAQPTPEPLRVVTAPPAPAVAEMSSKKRRTGLTAKVTALTLVVSLVPLLAFSGVILWTTYARMQAEQQSLAAEITAGLVGQVNEWFDKNARALATIAKTPEIVSMDPKLQEPVLKTLQKEYPWMYLTFTLDTEGMNIGRSDGEPLKNYSDRSYYREVAMGSDLAWQTLVSKTTGKPALVLSVPIKKEGALVGVLAAGVQIDRVSQLIASWKKGQTGFAFLVDEKGKVVAHQIDEYVQKEKNLKDHPLVAALAKTGEGAQRFVDQEGHPSVGYVRRTDQGWTLAIQQEEKEAYSDLQKAIYFTILVLGVTVVVVVLISLFAGRAIVTPIRQLTDAANRISVGELDTEIHIQSRDEIGDLADAVSRMQDSIRLSIERLRRRR